MNLLPRLVAVSLLAASLGAHATPLTNANIDDRTTHYDMVFSGLSFAGAYDQRSDLLQFHGAVGDSGIFDVTGVPPVSTFLVQPGAGMSASNLQTANANGDVFYTATVVGTSDVNLTQLWVNSKQLTSGITADGLYYLDFSAKNFGSLRTGGSFDFFVSIPGNWSTFGSALGQVQFLGINPEFTVVQNFVYDAGSNKTVFEAVDSNYGQVTTDLHFVLYGQAAPVPEPDKITLLALGAALLICGRRLRNRH